MSFSDLLRWAGQLQWQLQTGQVSFTELALEFESFAGPAPLAPQDQRGCGTMPYHFRPALVTQILSEMVDFSFHK